MKLHHVFLLILIIGELEATRPDSHAPIMVMGDHMHSKGEFMASYRFMQMNMDGMRSGTKQLSSADVFASNYTVTPTQMIMNMHMFGLMHAPRDSITLMGMIPYRHLEMNHAIFKMASPLIALNDGSTKFTTRSEGFGDLKLSSLIKINTVGTGRSHIQLGLSIPTGSVKKMDNIPGPGGRIERQLPAPMQMGSGTYDLLAGITYSNQKDGLSYGAQANGKVSLESKNCRGYQLGDQFKVLSWVSWLLSPNTSLSVTGYAKTERKLSGMQEEVGLNPPFALDRRTVPTAFGENYGGDQAGLSFGLNILNHEMGDQGHRLGLELDIPLYRDLNGLQLETDSTLMIGWQKSW